MKERSWFLGISFFVALGFNSSACGDSSAVSTADLDRARSADIAQAASGWSKPVFLKVNDAGWEDSAFISRDGRKLFFAYYPGDLITALEKGDHSEDLDIYVSTRPFKTKMKVTRYDLSEDLWSASGIMIDRADWYYGSNRDYANDQKADQDIYLNGKRLPFNDDRHHDNPHYCAAKDELWFGEDDKKIFVMKRAKATNFSGPFEAAPEPINVLGMESLQPFLTDDCMTLYFTSSNRERSPETSIAKIYRSTRMPNHNWSTPEPMVWSKFVVGEPTLTADGKRLFFVQVFKLPKRGYAIDMFYVERL